MITLGVTTDGETFERMTDPLRERGIHTTHIPPEGRVFSLTQPDDTLATVDVGFVYPYRLMEGGVIDALAGIPWVNDRAAVLTSRNKAGVIAALDQAGIPVPATTMVSYPVSDTDLQTVFDEFRPPVVVKPNSATRGIGIVKAHEFDTFRGVVDYLEVLHGIPAVGDRSFLVQETVDVTHDYRVMVLDGAYAGAVERELSPDDLAAGRWKHNVHQAASAHPVELSNSLRALTERVAGVLDIPFLGVDIAVTDDGVVVMETNARPTIDKESMYEPGFYDTLAGLIRAQE